MAGPGMMGPGMMGPGVAPGFVGGAMAGGMMGAGHGARMNLDVPLSEAAPHTGATAVGGFVHTVTLQNGICAERFFDPIYSAGIPMSMEEFTSVIDELNQAMDAAVPPRAVRKVASLLLGIGFFVFAAGGFMRMSSDSDSASGGPLNGPI